MAPDNPIFRRERQESNRLNIAIWGMLAVLLPANAWLLMQLWGCNQWLGALFVPVLFVVLAATVAAVALLWRRPVFFFEWNREAVRFNSGLTGRHVTEVPVADIQRVDLEDANACVCLELRSGESLLVGVVFPRQELREFLRAHQPRLLAPAADARAD